MYTDYRPTPLQHFMFPSGGDGLFLIVDERSTFREDNFQKAIAALTATAADGGAACYLMLAGLTGHAQDISLDSVPGFRADIDASLSRKLDKHVREVLQG